MNAANDAFLASLQGKRGYSVLEVGTRRWGSQPTHHKSWMSGWSTYVMSDVMPGEDVDVVADAHALTATFGEAVFDVFFAASVWEHLERPWVASAEVLRVLKPDGVFFIQTHQTFPLHGYPHDYFRFSRGALEVCFDGAIDVVSCYEFPCEIAANEIGTQRAWLNTCIFGRRGL